MTRREIAFTFDERSLSTLDNAIEMAYPNGYIEVTVVNPHTGERCLMKIPKPKITWYVPRLPWFEDAP